MNLNDLTNEIEIIGTIFGTVLFTGYIAYKTFISKLEKWRKEDKTEISKNINRQSEMDCELIKEAEKVKEIMGADRVQVYEFHNGIHYANGRSALRTSCTYEVCRYGIENYINKLSGIPLTVIPCFIKVLLDKGELLIENVEEIKEKMPSSYNLLSSMGVKSFYSLIVHNNNGEPVGFVMVQFCNENIKILKKDCVKKFVWFVETKLSEM